ncbi:MAG: D-alanyl-D-alanine dipeptidase, partial [Polaromonas sp.]|nr:D-alanyl-D-alanine dipeptidase [Polaromonas sp.]
MTPAPLIQIREATHDVVIDMMYAREDNFTGKVIYDHTLCFLHPEAEACLRRAVTAARGFGFKLKIFD